MGWGLWAGPARGQGRGVYGEVPTPRLPGALHPVRRVPSPRRHRHGCFAVSRTQGRGAERHGPARAGAEDHGPGSALGPRESVSAPRTARSSNCRAGGEVYSCFSRDQFSSRICLSSLTCVTPRQSPHEGRPWAGTRGGAGRDLTGKGRAKAHEPPPHSRRRSPSACPGGSVGAGVRLEHSGPRESQVQVPPPQGTDLPQQSSLWPPASDRRA